MAVTEFGKLTALQIKTYSTEIWANTRERTLLLGPQGFLGQGTGDATRPIHYIRDFTKTNSGMRAVMPLVQDLQEDGRAGDHIIEGYEEEMIPDSLEVQIDQLRHGTISKGKMAELETVIEYRRTAREKLKWWFTDKLDELAILTVAGIPYTKKLNGAAREAQSDLPNLRYASDVTAPSTNRVFYADNAGTPATSTGTLTTAHKVTWNRIVDLKAFAERKRIKPIRMNGKETFVLLITTEGMRDLKKDTNFQTNTGRAAGMGQDKNPLFSGADIKIDGLAIYGSNKVPNTLGATSGVGKYGSGNTVDGFQGLLLGAQALGFAAVEDGSYVEEKKDAGNRAATYYGRPFGFRKPIFKSVVDGDSQPVEDYSVISFYAAAASN
jgi:N4-gp56 family major capsid protein